MIRVGTLQEAVRKVSEGERVVVTIEGKDFALMSLDDLALFEEIEDRLDVQAYREAKAEGGEDVSWEDLKREVGLK